MTAAWRAGDSCDHGVSNVLGPGASEDCSVARYGSIWVPGSPDCCSIHSRAARQAWKYSSSVDSAAALTDVVTPPGEIPEPSAADGWVSVRVDAGDDGAGPPSVPDEHPTRTGKLAVARAAARAAARSGYLRIPTIYATLAAVIDGTAFQECCSA